ncbi:hypothetical protein CHS0354_039256 [Potamilus streckersoni]|uniref:G-protein coupled receptors family 1 profile domain-containing protein n=1 Tax=Potamilus streckersoni TaxID=2493646 RepID=A0AAE0VPL7_9BIVA|nr:hypothetical protein CHS0354_039256 [Potamilus streckersoni]
MCLIAVLTAGVLSWPCLVLYTIIDVDVPTPGSRIIQGYDCTTVRNDSFKVYVEVFNFMQVLMFFFTVIPLIVLYVSVFNKLKQFHAYRSGQLCLSPKPSVFQNGDNSKDMDTPFYCHNNADVSVSKKLKKPNDDQNLTKSFLIHNASEWKDMTNEISFMREEQNKFSQSESANNDESLRSIELERNNSVTEKEKQCPSIEPIQTVEDEEPGGTCVTFSRGEVTNIRLGSGYYFKKKNSTDLNKLRNTTLMLVIAITFITSFVPYLCLMVWRSLSTGNVANQMTDVQLVVFSIGIRSYFLNSTVNPIIYGVFNSQFRGIFASVFCTWVGAKSSCKTET